MIKFKNYLAKKPKLSPSVFIAEGAKVIGKVSLGKNSSVWFNAVLRADINAITIGEGTNIQDGSVLHVADDAPVKIGNQVTIGHGANVHGCRIGDETLIGAGAIVFNQVKIGKRCLVAAGAVVPEKMVVPDGKLVRGVPAKIIRDLTPHEIAQNRYWAKKYIELKNLYLKTRMEEGKDAI
jgi:carbonic anhydrase/acetyltransferase-like protein (isoleucine patch superfamily)